MNELQFEIKNREQEKQNEIQQLAGHYRQEKADLEHNFGSKVSMKTCECHSLLQINLSVLILQVRNLQEEMNQIRREGDTRISDLESVLRYVLYT